MNKKVSFKKNQENPVKQQPQNSEYYKTTSGVKTAAGYAATGLISMLGINKLIDKISENREEISKLPGAKISAEKLPKIGVGKAAWFLVTTFACGVFVDKFLNKKRAKLANDLKTKDADTLMKEDKHIRKTEKGNLYYKSDLYKNVGPLLALSVVTVNTVIKILGKKSLKFTKDDIWNAIDALCTIVIGGSILGGITDKFSNKAAREFADKNAK